MTFTFNDIVATVALLDERAYGNPDSWAVSSVQRKDPEAPFLTTNIVQYVSIRKRAACIVSDAVHDLGEFDFAAVTERTARRVGGEAQEIAHILRRILPVDHPDLN